MSQNLPFFQDGYFPPSGKDITVRSVPKYPFRDRQLPDTTSRTFERLYLINPGTYTPRIAERTIGVPDTDPDNATAYLAAETDPENYNTTRGLVRRTFAHIPADQVSYGSEFFSRPALHDLKSGSFYAVSFDDLLTSHLFDARKTASIGAPATTYLTLGNQLAVLAHQQVEITLNTGTSTFYLDDTDATIKDALSTAWTGNTSGAAFFYVGRWKYGLRITWAGASVTVRAINLTSTEVAIGGNTVTFGTASSFGPVEIVTAQTVLTSVRPVSSVGHTGVAGNRVALYNNDRLVALSTVAVATTDAFTIPTKDLPDNDAVVTHCVFDKDGFRVVNGTKSCSIRATEKFYLPGVTTGITTGADVPGVPVYTDPLAWFGRLVATTKSSATATAATDRLGISTHGMATGDTFWLGAIGSGAGNLAVRTQYWAIYVDANNIKVASSADNAKAGTAIDISSDGTGLTVYIPTPWPDLTATKLTSWMGPIVSRTVEAVQMSDALETRLPAA